jgi:hypothetical protein
MTGTISIGEARLIININSTLRCNGSRILRPDGRSTGSKQEDGGKTEEDKESSGIRQRGYHHA